MNFDDTPEEAAYRAKARAWIAANKFDFRNFPRVRDGFDTIREWQRIKQAAGWGCLHWPKQYGGQDATPIQNVIFSQEEEAAGISMLSVANSITIGMAAATIIHCGTQAQKDRHLMRIARGEEIWCQLFSEPVAGSDLAGIKTRAVRDGDDWIVNGQKVWTSYAHFADWAILVTRSDPTVPKHKGLTYFLLDMKSPGVEVRPIKQASGGSDFNEVFFDNVRIPDANRVGDEGDGWRVALTTLMNERAAISSVFPTNFDDVWRIARETPRGDGMAIDDGAVRSLLADWYVWHRGLKNFSLRLQSAISQGKTPGPEASAGKLMLAAQRQQYLSDMLDLLDMGGGALASGQDMGLHFAFLRVIGNRIEGGSDEVLRNIIGERVLGLPPEPRVDKGMAFSAIPTAL
ncbi:MAG: acyl-CoA dehydrogenase family protein [Sphingomonas sp.]|nr:acyl-CoA dehydrogenase family protein [Sphingomonas sp.]